MRACARTAVLAIVAALACSAPAGAATVIGSPLTNADTSGGICSGPTGVCTEWNTALPGATLAVPSDGVVTAFRVRTANALQARLRVLRGPTSATAVVTSTAFLSFAGTNAAISVDVRVPVKAADVLALGSYPGDHVPYAITSNATGACFDSQQPEPADGSPPQAVQTFCSGNEELLYNASVEPDADADGYGDETQDKCLASAGPDNGCPIPTPPPGPDVTKPVIATLSVSNPVFRVDQAAEAAQGDPRPRGTSFLFSLSEAATVTIRIERRARGRRVRGRCRRPTAINRRRPRCTRYVRMRTFTRSLAGGAATVPFSGRIRVRGGARSLKPGRYRAVLRARDAAGNLAAQAATVAFRIVR
jgi:hypothetical protein